MGWVAIRYRGFYDVPRTFTLAWKGVGYLFDCRFDDALDEYAEVYEVYQAPADRLAWERLPAAGDLKRIGSVAVSRVEFDPSRRRAISDEVLTGLGI